MPDPRYPHMMPRDIPIWDRWMQLHAQEFESFRYDVHVGNGAPIPDDIDPKWAETYADLTKKRIDVIAYKPGLQLIIEVKDIISFTAIGQIISYPILYSRTYGYDDQVAILLVAGGMLADLEPVLDELGIPFEIL